MVQDVSWPEGAKGQSGLQRNSKDKELIDETHCLPTSHRDSISLLGGRTIPLERRLLVRLL